MISSTIFNSFKSHKWKKFSGIVLSTMLENVSRTDSCLTFSLLEKKFLSSKPSLCRSADSHINCKLIRNSQDHQPTFSMEPRKNNSHFKISDYDCIGFDLDNTICEYMIKPVIEMEYDMIAKFMVEKKNYDYKYMYQPLSEVDMDFLQKGLILDFERGNVIQVSETGVILNASHGTSQMNNEEIMKEYGNERRWEVTDLFCKDMLLVWNGPLSEKLRTLLDYFDMPSSLAFARAVDSVDHKHGRRAQKYTVGEDVISALVNLYSREHFQTEEGGYFKQLKLYPQSYITKCKPAVIEWLRKVKQSKPTFLITGSNVDYASFTANYSLGEDWRELFDIVICYAKKPGFFTSNRPFLRLDGFKECEELSSNDLQFGEMYSQGNWQDLYSLLARETGISAPKCLYVGDNLVQDIFTPSQYLQLDTVAVIEELGAEGVDDRSSAEPRGHHLYRSCLTSKRWGSYFKNTQKNIYTVWGGIIKNHSKICVPSLMSLASQPLDQELKTFEKSSEEIAGYYPTCPISLRSLPKENRC